MMFRSSTPTALILRSEPRERLEGCPVLRRSRRDAVPPHASFETAVTEGLLRMRATGVARVSPMSFNCPEMDH